MGLRSPHPGHHRDLLSKLSVAERIIAISEAIPSVEQNDRDDLAMMLIEIASRKSESRSHATDDPFAPESAASPLELIRRLPMKRRDHQADQAMIAVARSWGAISHTMKELAVGLGRDRWLKVARELVNDPDPVARASVAMIAHDTADPGFGKQVGMLLSDDHQSVRKVADKAMLRMTMVMLEHLPPALLGEELAKIASTRRVSLPADPKVLELERCILLRAIADAAWSFASHRCRSPLLAALLVMDRAVATPLEREISSRMKRLLSEQNHPSHSPLRTVLRRTPSPILRERAFRWLCVGPMTSAAVDRLAVADSMQEHEVVLSKYHLALRPKRASRMSSIRVSTTRSNPEKITSAPHNGMIGEEQGFLPTRQVASSLSDRSRAGIVKLVPLMNIDETIKRDALEPMLADPDTHIRWSSALLSPVSELADYLYDVDQTVARSSAFRWSSVGSPAPKIGSPSWKYRQSVALINLRSPHSWVRQVALEESDRLSVFNPQSAASRTHARRLYASDPSAFVRRMRDQIANHEQCCDALMMIRILGIEQRFELDLIALMQSEQTDPKIRATAVMAMKGVQSNAVDYMLSEALHHDHPRVRSNAVESVHASPTQILELKGDDHHRVRASAIRRVLSESQQVMSTGQVAESKDPSSASHYIREAGDALLELLTDDRPMHRLAGTWVGQRVLTSASRTTFASTWKQLVEQMEAVSANDQEQAVRDRAMSCIRRLGVELDLSRSRSIARQEQARYGLGSTNHHSYHSHTHLESESGEEYDF